MQDIFIEQFNSPSWTLILNSRAGQSRTGSTAGHAHSRVGEGLIELRVGLRVGRIGWVGWGE